MRPYIFSPNNDIEFNQLVTEGYSGTLSGMQKAYLSDQGFISTDNINDMWNSFNNDVVNLWASSEDASSATPLRVDVTNNTVIAPDGQQTGDTITTNTASSCRIARSIAITSDTDYTLSCYMKAGNVNWGCFRILNYDNNYSMFYNLSTGQASGNTIGSDLLPLSYGMLDSGNGWYRCWATFQSTTDLSGLPCIYIAQADEDITMGVGENINVWGMMVNKGGLSPYVRT